jgi:hypothetical protein
LLCGLFSCAEITVRELYGSGARSAVVQAARTWRDCPAVNAAGVDPEVVQGYLSAAQAVDCMLAGDSDTAYALIDRVLNRSDWQSVLAISSGAGLPGCPSKKSRSGCERASPYSRTAWLVRVV